jgi:hypothetical protein
MIVPVLLIAAAIRIFEPGIAVDGHEKVPAPKIQMRMNEASATTVPWIDSNAWRFMRGLSRALYSELPAGTAALAAAEAHAWGVDAVLQPAPEDRDQLNAMLEFLKRIDAPRMPVLANVGIVDDKSDELPEVLNLMSRRNLPYKVVAAPDRKLDLNVQIGSAQYPRDAVKNPSDFAARVREKLTDEKRLVRLFNTYTVLVNLTGEGGKARLHLVNYSKRPVKDVRVRVLGVYRDVKLAEASDPGMAAKDVLAAGGATEFTVPQIGTYAVVDLR